MLDVTAFARWLLTSSRFSNFLLAGENLENVREWTSTMTDFWENFRSVQPSHPVFEDHASELHLTIPILMHGDEGVGHRRKPVLQISWGPVLGAGQASLKRLYLITSCPAKLYSQYNKGIEAGNPVIEKLLDAVGKSLMRAYFQGVELPKDAVCGVERIYLVCIALCGDHPWHVKSMKCLRHHTRKYICPLCLANIGAEIPFEDVSMNAMWTQTVGQSPPFQGQPPLWQVPGSMAHEFMKIDLMHTLPHGVGRNFAASAICMLAGPLGHFKSSGHHRRDKDSVLEAAYDDFSAYCRAVGQQARDVKEFTKENLHWESNNKFPDLTCKASDCTLLVQWLVDYLQRPFRRTEPLDLCFRTAVAFDAFNRLCYTSSSRVWFTRDEAQLAFEHIMTFLCCYKALTNWSFNHGWTLFMATPKLHFAAHFAFDLFKFLQSDAKVTFNPGVFATPMMEDFVGVTSRIARTSHPSSVARTVIFKYLVVARKAWAEGPTKRKEKFCLGLGLVGVMVFAAVL